MLQVATEPRAAAADAVREAHLTAFRCMLRARLLDDKFAALYRTGKIHGGVFLSRGQEALSAAVGLSLNKNDVFAPLIRDSAGRLAFGEPILDAVRTYLGLRAGAHARARRQCPSRRPQDGLLADDFALGRHGFGGQRRAVRAPPQADFRHRRCGLSRRRRHFHRRVS